MNNSRPNPIIFLQAHITRLYIQQHGLTVERFLSLDKQVDIIGYLREGYEIFHLTGDQGILDELESYIQVKLLG